MCVHNNSDEIALRRVTIRPLCKLALSLFLCHPPISPSTLDNLPHHFHLYPRGALIAPNPPFPPPSS